MHTDEHGKSTPAKSKVARKMRVALRGQKQAEHKAVAKSGKKLFKMGLTPQGEHRYHPESVNKAIASSNRAGRRISGKEGRMIHALLKGRH